MCSKQIIDLYMEEKKVENLDQVVSKIKAKIFEEGTDEDLKYFMDFIEVAILNYIEKKQKEEGKYEN